MLTDLADALDAILVAVQVVQPEPAEGGAMREAVGRVNRLRHSLRALAAETAADGET